jgi:hypothetical protein
VGRRRRSRRLLVEAAGRVVAARLRHGTHARQANGIAPAACPPASSQPRPRSITPSGADEWRRRGGVVEPRLKATACFQVPRHTRRRRRSRRATIRQLSKRWELCLRCDVEDAHVRDRQAGGAESAPRAFRPAEYSARDAGAGIRRRSGPAVASRRATGAGGGITRPRCDPGRDGSVSPVATQHSPLGSSFVWLMRAARDDHHGQRRVIDGVARNAAK